MPPCFSTNASLEGLHRYGLHAIPREGGFLVARETFQESQLIVWSSRWIDSIPCSPLCSHSFPGWSRNSLPSLMYFFGPATPGNSSVYVDLASSRWDCSLARWSLSCKKMDFARRKSVSWRDLSVLFCMIGRRAQSYLPFCGQTWGWWMEGGGYLLVLYKQTEM